MALHSRAKRKGTWKGANKNDYDKENGTYGNDYNHDYRVVERLKRRKAIVSSLAESSTLPHTPWSIALMPKHRLMDCTNSVPPTVEVATSSSCSVAGASVATLSIFFADATASTYSLSNTAGISSVFALSPYSSGELSASPPVPLLAAGRLIPSGSMT